MAMNYNDLTGDKTIPGSLLNFVNYKKVPVEIVLEEAQALIYAQLRVREMQVSTGSPFTLAAGASSIALPGASTGQFLEPIALKDREGIVLIPNDPEFGRWSFISPTEMAERRVYENDVLAEGTPCAVAIYDEALQFDVKADEQRKYDFVYYRRPDYLSPTTQTNWLTLRYPHMLRTACQAAAADFMKDIEEYNRCLARLVGLISAANAESDMGRAT